MAQVPGRYILTTAHITQRRCDIPTRTDMDGCQYQLFGGIDMKIPELPATSLTNEEAFSIYGRLLAPLDENDEDIDED